VRRPDIPTISNSSNFFEALVFATETPSIVKHDGEECYKVEIKIKDTKLNYPIRIYLISKTNNLIVERQLIQEKEYGGVVAGTHLQKYKDYTKVGNIMVPQKILNYYGNKGKMPTLYEEITIGDFAFKDDIPDSLFEVPKQQ
jgi:hypothetical protein